MKKADMIDLLQRSVEQKPLLRLFLKYCSGPAEIAAAGPVEKANFGSREKATTRILSDPLY